jgi:hypothetical protein
MASLYLNVWTARRLTGLAFVILVEMADAIRCSPHADTFPRSPAPRLRYVRHGSTRRKYRSGNRVHRSRQRQGMPISSRNDIGRRQQLLAQYGG